jgi:hypothetical protein
MILNRLSSIPAIGMFSMVFALLVIATSVRGSGFDQAKHQQQELLYLPLLSSRHDPTLNPPAFGVQMYGNSGPTSDYFPYLVDSGSTWVRASISWSTIEPIKAEPPSYNWSSADLALSAARLDAGALSLIATIVNNPDWAATYRNGPINPGDLDSFAAVVHAAVELDDGDGVQDAPGSPVVRHWEFYNEPDALIAQGAEPHWGGEGAQYANMLSIVYPVVKNADPAGQVLIGGLAYDWFVDQNGHFDRQFLDDVMAFDDGHGGDYFDIMNFHTYPAFWYNWTAHESPGLLEKAGYIKVKLADYGYADKGIVVTESGWHSNNPSNSPSDPEDQARYVVELFTQSMAVEAQFMIWWMLYDPGGLYQFENGLVTSGSPPEIKPAFLAFQVVESELGSAHFQRILPLDEPEPGEPYMEAYEFKDNVHQRTVYVAWLDPIDAPGIEPLRIPASMVTVRDIYGASYNLSDSQDGQVDGYVTVDVGGQPRYIEVAW